MERRRGSLKSWTALVLIASMSMFHWSMATAGIAPSTRSNASTISTARDADLLVAQRTLENKVVAQKLRDYGVSADATKLKLASMSDQDLHRLASASKGLPSGGDATGAIIGILVVVILVIVILKLMNKQVVVR